MIGDSGDAPGSGRLRLAAWRVIGKSLYPFMGAFLRMRARRGKEELDRRHERYGYPSERRPEGPAVWIHAASVGEALAVLPLIRRMDERGLNAILTTGTVTSAKVVRDRLPASAIHQYAPLDFERGIKRFLDHWKPDLALFAESEIWPATFAELSARGIPQALINARMSDRSFRNWSRHEALAGRLLSGTCCVVAQSEADAERFRRLGAERVIAAGNIKSDALPPPCDPDELLRVRQLVGGRPTWIAASLHPGEEPIAIECHRKLRSSFPDLLSVIVPRHPHRGEAIASLAERGGLKAVRRSREAQGDSLSSAPDLYVGDTVGEMGLYLRLGEVAFMGRSLAERGGQNPLEPAMTSTAIISGVHVGNFRDVYDALDKAGGVALVADEAKLSRAVGRLLRSEAERREMIEAAARCLGEMKGAMEKTMSELEVHLFPLAVSGHLERLNR